MKRFLAIVRPSIAARSNNTWAKVVEAEFGGQVTVGQELWEGVTFVSDRPMTANFQCQACNLPGIGYLVDYNRGWRRVRVRLCEFCSNACECDVTQFAANLLSNAADIEANRAIFQNAFGISIDDWSTAGLEAAGIMFCETARDVEKNKTRVIVLTDKAQEVLSAREDLEDGIFKLNGESVICAWRLPFGPDFKPEECRYRADRYLISAGPEVSGRALRLLACM